MRSPVAVPVLLLLLAAAVTVPAPATAGLGIFGSWWDGDALDSGFGGGLKADINIIPTPLFGLDVRASYLAFGSVDSVDGTVSVIPLEATGQVKLGLFYGGLGIGYYVVDKDIDSRLGWFPLVGANIALRGFGIFGEGLYRVIDGQPMDGVAFNLGVTVGL